MAIRKLQTTQETGFWDEEAEVIPFKYEITAYGADYDVEGLVRRIEIGDIYVPAFQRAFIWTPRTASRFIESLLLGLPVPGIFLSKELDTNRLLVIDGQQRLRTLQQFYKGIFRDTGREFALKDVQPQYEGKTYSTLSEEDRRQLNNSIIHATVVKQDKPTDDSSSIYYLFERLNTGGTQLSSQHIRASIYHGELDNLLEELDRNKAWRELFGPPDKKLADQELLLRFFALYHAGSEYRKPMKEFLNHYMGKNRHLDLQSREVLVRVFIPTVETLLQCIGSRAFRPKKSRNIAVADAVMIGVARRLTQGSIEDCEQLKKQYEELIHSKKFQTATESATTDEENIRSRLRLATAAFANVK